MPDSVKSIAGGFGSRSMKEVVLPRGLESLGGYAFSGCSSLTKITIPEGLTEIPGGCFKECSKLEIVCLPSTLRYIGRLSFYGPSSIKKVYYKGTEEDWNKIVDDDSRLVGTKYWYSETKPKEAGNYWYYVGQQIVEW